MITEAIIAALITGGVTLMGAIISNNSMQKVTAYKIDELKKDFDNLRKKVEQHNNLVERMAVAEQSIKSVNKRIDDIRTGGND